MVSHHKAYYKNNLYLYIFIICNKDTAPIEALFTVKRRKKNKPQTENFNWKLVRTSDE